MNSLQQKTLDWKWPANDQMTKMTAVITPQSGPDVNTALRTSRHGPIAVNSLPDNRAGLPVLWILLLVPFLYLASLGPFVWVATRGAISEPTAVFIVEVVYYPVVQLNERTDFFTEHPAGRTYAAYVNSFD